MKQTITKLVDDLDGSDATETIRFGMDGAQFSIDLSAVHAKELRELFAPYRDAGRKLARNAVPKSAPVGRSVGREQNQAIRHWAIQQGKGISARGRIPADVVAEFEAAHR